MIEVADLHKRYRKATAVDGLSFRVPAARITAFLGPNGAGKTTTLRILLGLVRATSGSAMIDGKAYRELAEPVRHVGAVLEASNYHPKRSGRSHLRVLCTATGLPWSRADELLEFVGIANAAGRAVGGYSLGMRQRLSVAGALLGDPQLLVLDEPANGLDPEGIRWLRDFLRAFAAGGKTVFISSHVLGEVEQLADEVVIIHRGRLVAHQSVADLRARAVGATRIRSPDAARLREALGRAGIDAEGEGDRLSTSAPAERVGEVAAADGIVLHELTADAPSLEEAFLELTAGESL
ncbi:MAG: ABC transporter ATP-binding protein [Actinobacteria bacterium]|nr:MAG: ABC transporter ATP-binding protein [Actinomycetota bacterium]